MSVNEYFIGQKASLKKAFTDADVKAFASISGDCNPIHLDEEYAANSMFKARIVHGFLAGSLISAVFGTLLPGPGAIYLHQDMDFRKPVYLDEEITAEVEVTKINLEKRVVHFSTRCVKTDGTAVIEGTAVLKV